MKTFLDAKQEKFNDIVIGVPDDATGFVALSHAIHAAKT